jgi:hypothetical protein
MSSFLAGRSRTMANVSVLSVASVAIVVAAATSDGYRATNVDLDDGAVWVTDASANKLGRLVIEIDQVDVVRTTNPGPDVIQDGRQVIAGDALGTQWISVETATPSTAGSTAPLSTVRMGGDTLVVHEAESGKIWTGSATGVIAPEFPRGAVGLVAKNSLVEVTGSGRVIVIDPAVPEWYEVELDATKLPVTPRDAAADDEATTTTDAPADTAAEEAPPVLQPTRRNPIGRGIPEGTVTTVVGEQVVMLTPDGEVVALDGRTVSVPGSGWRLQQRTPAAGDLLVATDEGLFAVDFDGEAKQLVSGQPGLPAAPVRVASCVYGAWASTSAAAPTYSYGCGSAEPTTGAITGAVSGSLLEYRVNRKNIALNSLEDGGVWAMHDGALRNIGNWSNQSDDDTTDDTPDEADEDAPENDERCERDDPNTAPVANPDELGARSNVQTLLDVLSNDTDSDCDPISIEAALDYDDSFGTFTSVDNGQRILYTPNDTARGLTEPKQVEVRYRVVDARREPSAQPAVATVRLAPQPGPDDDASSNRAPDVRPDANGKQRPQRVTVESGEEITFDALADWYDPDGDEITLVSARIDGDVGEVSFSPLGRIRFSVPNANPGTYDLQIVVSDGRATTTGVVEATVEARGTQLEPHAADDFVTVAVGGTVVVSPLANDGDPNGVREQPSANFGDTAQYRDQGLEVVYRSTSQELSIHALTSDEGTAAAPGLYAIGYSIIDVSGLEAQATVQVNVLAPSAENSPPVAVPDRTVMRPGRTVNVDVLDNDIDPDGDLLAVLSASAEPVDDTRGGVRVAVVDRRFLQVELVRPLDGTAPTGPFVVGYTATDGSLGEGSSRAVEVPGQLVVLVDGSTNDQAPVGVGDELVVREGRVTSVDVLANDVDPDGDEIRLTRTNPEQTAQRAREGAFLAWSRGSEVFVRGGTAGQYELAYDIEANNRQGSGLIRVRVTPAPSDDSPNLPPTPRPIEVRVARGTEVRIPVPLTGIDPDGDEVVLSSVLPTSDPAASVATVSADEPGVILYRVAMQSGLRADRFQYEVRDTGSGGTTVLGEVRVAIIGVDRSPPVAHDDVVRVRPGRELVVPVLANDVDADDDQLRLADPAFLDTAGVRSALPLRPDLVEAFADADNPVLRGGALRVQVPADGTVAERYVITDGMFESWAYVRVVTDPTAPNLAPTTEGRRVETVEVADKASGSILSIDVRAVSLDPDGPLDDLTFAVPEGQPGVVAVANGDAIDVTLTPGPQIVVYSVTDGDADDPRTAYGVLHVPGVDGNAPPVLRDPDRVYEIQAPAAGPLVFDLATLVVDPDGDQVQLTGKDIGAPAPLVAQRADDNRSFEVTVAGEVTARREIPVSIQVEDRPDDPAVNLRPTLTFVVRVIPADVNNPPYLLTNGQLDVPLFQEPQTIDLRTLVEDDEGDEITFVDVASPSAGISVSQAGSVLTVTGTDQAARLGPAGAITFSFTDGQEGRELVTGSVAITITQTNRAAPVAADLTAEAVVGRPADGVDVVAAATNSGGFDLEIASVTTTSGSLNCYVDCGITPIVFTPTAPGTFTVNYTLTEQIIDQPRPTSGTITYVVKGPPLAPGTPSIDSVGDQRVTLSWTDADMQGGTLVEYVVRALPTGDTLSTTSTSLEFTGLTNDQQYTFEVFAVNEIGAGAVSNRSAPARPDTVPEPPVGPRFTSYENGALNLAWGAPPSAGSTRYSAIQEYEIELAGYGLISNIGASSLSFRQAGLTNGTDYTFRVRARNSADVNGGWGEWSVLSAPERPSTSPSQVTSVSVTPSGDGGQARALITWPAPADGGRPILSYNVCSVPATLGCQSADLTRSTQFGVPAGSTFTFTVQAVNSDVNTPNGPVSAPSAAFQGIVLPGPPVNLQVSNPASGTLVATATVGNNGGCSTTFTEYNINNGAWQPSGLFSGLTNGVTYSVQVRARIGSACQQFLPPANQGAPWSAPVSRSGTPYGPLVVPSITASVSGPTITYNWNASQGANGRTWTGQIIGEGCDRTFGAANPSGPCGTTPGYNSGARTVTVRVTDTLTGEVVSNNVVAATGPPPPPVISTSNSGASAGIGTQTYVAVSGVSFSPGARLEVLCGGSPTWWFLGTADGNGNFGTIRSVCRHDASVAQLITVRDTFGREASQLSQW